MNALISGRAGFAVLVEGTHACFIDVRNPDTTQNFTTSFIPYLFDGTDEVEELNNTDQNTAVKQLKFSYASDRALQLILILLDKNEEFENRNLAATYASELLRDELVYELIQNRLFTAPLPSIADVTTASSISHSIGTTLEKLLREIIDNQTNIRNVYDARNNISINTFGSAGNRSIFESQIRRCKISRLLALSTRPISGSIVLEAHQLLQGIPHARFVIQEWVNKLGIEKRSDILALGSHSKDLNEIANTEIKHERSKHSVYAKYTNVLQQKEAIKIAIERGDLSLASKFASELIEKQIQVKDSEKYASMSLCDLSQCAKQYRHYSLQLEFAQRAVEIAPNDGRAYCHLADAYMVLGQIDDASRAFAEAKIFGEDAYAANGKARILRFGGRLKDAERIYDANIQEFPECVYAWLGKAEVLRDMWLINDSLSIYDEAAARFPDDLPTACGRANVYKELGKFEEAINEYDRALAIDNTYFYARNGRANVLAEMGNLRDALVAYEATLKKFPGDSVAWCGAAHTQLEMGNAKEAIISYINACKKFPHIAVPFSGLAKAYLECGQLREASNIFNHALQQFPKDEYVQNGYADCLAKNGKLEASLQAYDLLIHQYPFNFVAKNARADTLKQLGRIEDATKAYQDLMKILPHDRRVVNSFAAVLIDKGRFNEAKKLLPLNTPLSQQDWISLHLRGMLLYKKGKLDEAEIIFQRGINECPWYYEKEYFRNALAIIKIRQNKLSEAVNSIIESRSALGNILAIHVQGELRQDVSMQTYKNLQENCPPLLVNIRDELAARYIFRKHIKHTKHWLLEQETRASLLRAA